MTGGKPSQPGRYWATVRRPGCESARNVVDVVRQGPELVAKVPGDVRSYALSCFRDFHGPLEDPAEATAA